jgi:hypothetical protein
VYQRFNALRVHSTQLVDHSKDLRQITLDLTDLVLGNAKLGKLR